MARRREFSVANAYHYNQTGPWHWVFAHVQRYWVFAITTIACFIGSWVAYSTAQVMIGSAAAEVIAGNSTHLVAITLAIFGLLAADGFCMLIGYFAAENISTRFEADAREELYVSLLGKSQTFHDRQRVGDIMARATDDTNLLCNMVAPGAALLFESVLGIIVPIGAIILIEPQLALIPLGFIACYIVAAQRYMRQLDPVLTSQRDQYGTMNAGLEETISGIEVVKASAREIFERTRFRRNARIFRDLFAQQGRIEAFYLPLLMYSITLGLTFLHAMLLYRQGQVQVAQIIGVMGLVNVLRFPTFISIFAFSTVQSGVVGAQRILSIITAEAQHGVETAGYAQPIHGALTFEGVVFSHDEKPMIDNVSFHIEPGQTVAIVGQTGSGKSTLTRLINRTYDASQGRVLIDGVDVQEWNLDALRSQIGRIEQDIFLFSRSIADNIAFGAPNASHEQIEAAAKAAQAHEFITSFREGYATVIGERGVTLSGGQRQRIALARAFLSDPRILILDDSTSAIDSATEDQIQRAIRHAQQNRTTILITHRISQIRWADLIVVMDQGRVVASGNHTTLLQTSPHYQRIFARYERVLPQRSEPLVA